jgi:hypothetical protein
MEHVNFSHRRLYFERDQHRYPVRAPVRTVLSKYAAVLSRNWTYAINHGGRCSNRC